MPLSEENKVDLTVACRMWLKARPHLDVSSPGTYVDAVAEAWEDEWPEAAQNVVENREEAIRLIAGVMGFV